MQLPIVPTAADFLESIQSALRAAVATDDAARTLSLDEGGRLAVGLLLEAHANRSAVALVGNGGSAAIAAHMQNDLCCAVGVRALVFNDPPLLTALSNDFGYATAFERALDLWGQDCGLLVAISSSGRSENILRAASTARKRGARVLTLSGFGPDNPLRTMGEVNFHVPSRSYGVVEVVHSILAHYLTDAAAAVLQGRSGQAAA